MSSLTDIEKRYFEKLLDMGGGYVLDYTDASFGEFFRRHKVDIHSPKYQTIGTSKAKKLRSFWEQESDKLVAEVLSEMVASYQASCELDGKVLDKVALSRSKEIIARLSGKATPPIAANTENEFLDREFSIPNIEQLPVEPSVVPIIKERLQEARTTLKSGANLSVIFLCGSVLEGVLLGAAQRQPAAFNKASASPKKRDGSVRNFQDWTLANLIDVSCEIGLLKPDVKKFSHGLRDFRNYIHPYQQMASGFAPDKHTAKVCFQVLKAALASVAGERG
ncbi:hypothetical protein [Litorimonas sp.]|uniref:hypothetical protein n=1 Tax=Litorimonas sp. TaxID=1892381 RepID=UPI003A86AF75